jgi:DNA-binding transcriptional LysR family regulator
MLLPYPMSPESHGQRPHYLVGSLLLNEWGNDYRAQGTTVYTALCIMLINETNKMTSIELSSLRHLVVLVRERSVTRAAQHLGLSQPAVSHALAMLRRHFDDALLVRSSHGMLPTHRALELAEAAAGIIEAADRLVHARQGFDPASERSAFVLTIPEFLERELAPPLLQRLQNEAPGVAVEMRAPNPDLSRAWLDSGEIDFRIAWIRDPWPESRFARLPDDRLVCLVRAGHPRIGARLELDEFFSSPHVRPFSALRTHTLQDGKGTVSLEQYMGVVHRLRGVAARHAKRRLRIAMVAQSFSTIQHLVAESDTIATVTERLARTVDPRLRLRILRPPFAFPPMRGALYWHERTHTNPRHRWFRRLFLEVARQTAGE